MSDNSDKTVIGAPRAHIDKNVDATRVAPKAPRAEQSADDKTRIAVSSHGQSRGEKGLEISVKGNANNNDADNLTRFNPKVIVPADKTRVKQSTNNSSNNHDSSSAIELGGTENHGVLKGRFILEQVLGAGGMGVVYKAKDLLKVEAQDRDPYVAIKVLGEEFKSHPEAFISLQRESRKSQRIAHPNIVNVHDFDRDGDTVFMTMEFMEGSPLDKLIRQYKSTGLPTDDAWQIIEGMSLALSHAHAENIVHSDFKPGNVFVTTKGVAKVFDFGISRAVAIAEHNVDNPEDKTIFDAGSLGALTPAYASLEMLEGKQPDFRDDVYALGCVAYEMLTGTHPYNKTPADEAEKQGLKPKRIQNIKKFQWKAIEKAISLRRENRTESVEKFLGDISPKLTKTGRVVPIAAVVIAAVISGYFVFFQEKTPDPYSEFDIRNEIELKVRIDFYKENLEELLKDPDFSQGWQDDVWKDISDLIKLTRGEDPWVFEKKKYVYQLYIAKISDAIKAFKLKDATTLLAAARRYSDDQAELDSYEQTLAKAYEQVKQRADIRPQVTPDKNTTDNDESKKQGVTAEKNERIKLFDLAFANVSQQLKCQGRLNMADFESSIYKLREVDGVRYKEVEGRIVTSLSECIVQMGGAFPLRAEEAKKQSLRIFKDNKVLASIEIKPRDPCDISLAGLGARGKRAICKDKISGKKDGPDLVVIPGGGAQKPFAIGKYEISVGEMNVYCNVSHDCTPIADRDKSLPVSNVSFDLVKHYLKWLSNVTGEKYRLPTRGEWLYAASSQRKKLDPNRNCKLSARGIQKGEELVSADMGAQNSWGVVNYVGNVQEWVFDKGRKLVAVGGSYKQPMDECTIETIDKNATDADAVTGFRVLRELRSQT